MKRALLSALLVSALCTVGYFVWLRFVLGAPANFEPGLLFFKAIVLIGTAAGMNAHAGSLFYLVPIAFSLFFVFFLLVFGLGVRLKK